MKDLTTGEHLPDIITPTGYGAAWSADENHLFYTTLDAAHRPWKLWRHRLGTDQADDSCVHTEEDEAFFLGVSRTRSRAWLVMDLHAAESSEVRILRADDPEGTWQVVAPRRPGIEYTVEHHRDERNGDRFLVVTNDEGPDFRLAQAPVDDPGPDRWVSVIPHEPGVRIVSVDAFARHLVVSLRADGRTELDVIDAATGARRRIGFDEPIYTVDVGVNREYDTSTVRIDYASLTTPNSVVDIDLDTDSRELRKQQPVLNVDLRSLPVGAGVGHRRRRHQGADLAGVARGPTDRRAAAPVRLRVVRTVHGSVVLHPAAVVARPWRGLRDRARARRR